MAKETPPFEVSVNRERVVFKPITISFTINSPEVLKQLQEDVREIQQECDFNTDEKTVQKYLICKLIKTILDL